MRHLASSLAVLAIVLLALMPTLTSVWSHAPMGVDICTADAGRGSVPADSHHPLDHCPYCALHADLTLPMPPAIGGAAVMVLLRELPPAFLAAPRASSIWSTAQSRAPPAFA